MRSGEGSGCRGKRTDVSNEAQFLVGAAEADPSGLYLWYLFGVSPLFSRRQSRFRSAPEQQGLLDFGAPEPLPPWPPLPSPSLPPGEGERVSASSTSPLSRLVGEDGR